MYQRMIIVGNLGQDPDLRYTPSGQAVTNLSVATNRKWTGNDGQVQEETIWFRVSVWGKQAEVCNEYLTKGRQVLCEGRLTPDKETGGPRVYQGQDGKWRASYEMMAETVRFLGGNGNGGNGNGGQRRQGNGATPAPEEEWWGGGNQSKPADDWDFDS